MFCNVNFRWKNLSPQYYFYGIILYYYSLTMFITKFSTKVDWCYCINVFNSITHSIWKNKAYVFSCDKTFQICFLNTIFVFKSKWFKEYNLSQNLKTLLSGWNFIELRRWLSSFSYSAWKQGSGFSILAWLRLIIFPKKFGAIFAARPGRSSMKLITM